MTLIPCVIATEVSFQDGLITIQSYTMPRSSANPIIVPTSSPVGCDHSTDQPTTANTWDMMEWLCRTTMPSMILPVKGDGASGVNGR